MASFEAVMTALRLLAVNFAGDVTAEKGKLWVAALDDVSDAALSAAIPHVIKTHKGDFIPPVAVVRDAAGANQVQAVDVDALIRQIDKAGSYNPNSGWCPPRVEVVRAQFGDVIADAYGAVGGPSRLFGSSDVTREIASRDFAKALADAPLGSPNPKAISGRAGDAGSSPALKEPATHPRMAVGSYSEAAPPRMPYKD